VSAHVRWCPLLSHSSSPQRSCRKNPCYNRRVKQKCSSVVRAGSPDTSGRRCYVVMSRGWPAQPSALLTRVPCLISRRRGFAEFMAAGKPEFSGIPTFRNRQNRRTRRFSTDSTAPYQVLTTNQNRRTPIFRPLTLVVRPSTPGGTWCFAGYWSLVFGIFRRCLTLDPFLKCACS